MLHAHPGARIWNTHPPSTASLFGRINPEPSHATASTHRSPDSVPIRVRIRVRVGWSPSGTTANPPLHTYVPGTTYIPGTRYFGIVVVVHFIAGAFQTRTSGCAYNTTPAVTPYSTSTMVAWAGRRLGLVILVSHTAVTLNHSVQCPLYDEY